jgi:hypothetical protein
MCFWAILSGLFTGTFFHWYKARQSLRATIVNLSPNRKVAIVFFFFLFSMPLYLTEIYAITVFPIVNFASVLRIGLSVWILLALLPFHYDLLRHVYACLALSNAFQKFRANFEDIFQKPTLERLQCYIVSHQEHINMLDIFNSHFSNYISMLIVMNVTLFSLSVYALPLLIQDPVYVWAIFVGMAMFAFGCLALLLVPPAMLYDEVNWALLFCFWF